MFEPVCYPRNVPLIMNGEKLGDKVTPHILRHTYITNLLLKGVDIKTVQYLAGHERAKITLDIYAHLTYNRPEEIIEKINMAFAPGAVTGN